MVADAAARAEVDLRGADWPVRDQGTTGACVGFAAGGRRAALALPAGRPAGRRRAAVAAVHLDGQQGDGSAHVVSDDVHRVGRHADQARLTGRAALRLRAGEHPAHGRLAELAEHGGVLCQGGPVPHRQLPQPGTRPGAVAGVDLQPGAGPGAAGGGPEPGAGDGRGRELDRYREDTSRGGHAAFWWGTRGRTSSSGTVGGSGGATAALRMRRTPMPRAPSARRTARCHDPASCRRGGLPRILGNSARPRLPPDTCSEHCVGFAPLTSALAHDVAELKNDVAGLKNDVGHLKGSDLEMKVHRRIRPLLSQHLGLRRARVVQSAVHQAPGRLRGQGAESSG